MKNYTSIKNYKHPVKGLVVTVKLDDMPNVGEIIMIDTTEFRVCSAQLVSGGIKREQNLELWVMYYVQEYGFDGCT